MDAALTVRHDTTTSEGIDTLHNFMALAATETMVAYFMQDISKREHQPFTCDTCRSHLRAEREARRD